MPIELDDVVVNKASIIERCLRRVIEEYTKNIERDVMELRRRTSDIYYFSDKESECDFVVHPHSGAPLCLQACYKLTADNEAREIAGLVTALSFFDLAEGSIITADTQDEIIHKGKRIHVRKGFV